MKHKINIIGTIILFLTLSFSCVDDTTQLFNVEKPESIAQKEYLNDYDALKTYISNSAGPNFKLGAGVTVSDYINEGLTYRAINSNFDRVTAGNAMKYGSVVGDDGSMNFGPIIQFVNAAKVADTEIYGHTLLWHAQQNKKYLERIIDDKVLDIDPDQKNWRELVNNNDIEGDDVANFFATEERVGPKPATIGEPGTGVDGGRAIVVQSGDDPAETHDTQFFVTIPDFTFKEGDNYKLSLKYRADKPASGSSQAHFNPGEYHHWTFVGDLAFTTEWKTHEIEGVIGPDHVGGDKKGVKSIAFNLAAFAEANTYYFDDISWQIEELPTGNIPVTVFETDFSDGEVMGGWGNGSTREVVDGVLEMNNPSAVNFWEAQSAYDFAGPLIDGETYFLSFKVKGSGNGELRSGFQDTSNYSSGGDFASVSFNTEWKEILVSTVVTLETASRFLFSFGDFVGTIYLDDIHIYYEIPGGVIPLTPEEKADTLTYAMETWIAGMMEATDGYVLAWDVVNEALIGEDKDGDGKYDLRSAEHASETELANDFYWGDYLGDEYVRLAVKFARQYGPSDIKLFVNDFNLESDWDDNQKLKSLIKWIEHWEDDGVTVIDGIGTQMHVSCYMNPDIQASKEDHVVKMFELMAATGKLVVVTELDMGLVDENGDKVLTVDATDEQLQAMSDYYKFIVQKYLEIIPASQQAGITHWCPTDSPADSSWRGGEPVGLWTERFSTRKHTYAGFADGLSGN